MPSILYRPLDSLGKPQKGSASFTDAVRNPTTQGGGLFVPRKIAPVYPKICGSTYQEQCFSVLRPYISEEEIPDKDLRSLLSLVTFAPKIHKFDDNIFCHDLASEAPREAFKCFGMVFNDAAVDYMSGKRGIISTSLGGSTGDTGASAQYHAKGKKNIRSVMLYPAGRVSEYQEAQMCLDGDNLIPVRVSGTDFNGCMDLVNRAFMDPDLKHLNLVAPNSKSVARWLPQLVYYVTLCDYISKNTGFKKIEGSIPTGNAGNAASAIAAQNAIRNGSVLSDGAVITKVHMASNKNNVIPHLYGTGTYAPLNIAHQTHSSAMDVAKPSNLLRILNMYGLWLTSDGHVYGSNSRWNTLLEDTSAQAVSDSETEETMRKWYVEEGIILEPHSAVAARGMESLIGGNVDKETAYFFAKTAEPKKFSERVNQILGEVAVPEPDITWDVQAPLEIEKEYQSLKKVLLSLN